MRAVLISLACVIGICAVAGCSDDGSPSGPSAAEEPLAQIDYGMQLGTSVPITDENIISLSFASYAHDTLFSVRVTAKDEGKIKTVAPLFFPPFKDAADRLTDGVDDMWTFWILIDNGFGGGTGTVESVWLDGGYSGDYHPDLIGADITKVRVYIDTIDIVQDNGNYQCTIAVHAVILGRP